MPAAPPVDVTLTDAGAGDRRQHVVLRPRPPLSWQDITDVWAFRGLLRRLALRDITLRYRQTALGVVWVGFQPLLGAVIFAVIFGRVAKLPSAGVPYFLFAFVGMMGWTLFSATLTKINGSLVGNAALISRVYFPRLVLPLSTLASSLIDFGITLLLLVVLMIGYSTAVGTAVVLVLPAALLLLCLALGTGLIATSLTVRFRDVAYVLPILIQFLLYASPVAYGLDAVPESLRPYFIANPVTAPLELLRHAVLGSPAPGATALTYSVLMAAVLLVAGYATFKFQERQFADVI